ncbi:hypothetical protein POPTR_017G072340v4 [Populus trichocarpa]|uniref:Uncharacterized protein n=1 Tax=Populus trichocarpa TaxID=3694 RepID=A0ACC0RQ00_POPTR|nr:hypothetical protein POPTR_017G072340v4 [Populus trichocarpa]
MGQKINPLGFRLEDQKIRNCIKNYVQKNMKISSGVEGIGHIEIQKRIDVIQVIIYLGFPKFLTEGKPKRIKELQINVQKELNCMNRKVNISITRIENPYMHPNVLAEFIAGQLKNRVSFRKAMKKAIELTEQSNTKGIQKQYRSQWSCYSITWGRATLEFPQIAFTRVIIRTTRDLF